MPWIKGALALLLAGGLTFWCSMLWTQTFEPEYPSTTSPGLIAAFSEAEVTDSAMFWFTLRPPRPSDKDELGEIRFTYSLAGTAEAPTSVGYVMSGQLAKIFSGCNDTRVSIKRDVTYDDLAATAKAALAELARTGAADGQQPSTSQTLNTSEIQRLLYRDTYTVVDIPVSPKSGAISKTPDIVGAVGLQICNVVEGRKMWDRLSGRPRVVLPPIGAALPKEAPRLHVYPAISVYTDDIFFLVHSSREPNYSGGMTEIQSAVSTSNYPTKIHTSTFTSATFSGPSHEANSRNVTLLIGVLLGAVASILITLLSKVADVVIPALAARWPTRER